MVCRAQIEATAKTFADWREAPPVLRCLPPVAGAVAWARSLFARLRRTMGQLRALEPLLEALDPGRRAVLAYTELARTMLAFEKQAFAAWCAGEAATAGPALQQPLLVRCAASIHSSSGDGINGEAAVSASAAPSSALESPFVVNLLPALLRLIREARHLDRMGFAVPELVVNVALQEGRLRVQAEALAGLLEHRRSAVGALSAAERALLRDQLARLDAVLEPALVRLNWVSLAVPQFVATATKASGGRRGRGAGCPWTFGCMACAPSSHHQSPRLPTQAIEQFQALSGQVKRHAVQIERAVAAIARTPLLPSLATGCSAGAGSVVAAAAAQQQEHQVLSLQEFYDRCEQARQAVVESLVARYRSISALLLKVEEAVTGSASGRAPKLAPYVAYWEHRVFAAISSAVLRAMNVLGTRLRGGRPLLHVQLALLASEVVVSPSMAEVSKQLSRLMRNVVDSAKAFVRWMDGTCLEAPPQ